MAFENKKLTVMACAGGFTWWQYKDNEPIKTLTADAFFDPIYTLLACGDLITIVANDTTDTYYVKSIRPTKLKKQGE